MPLWAGLSLRGAFVLPFAVAYVMTSLLTSVVQAGTGSRARALGRSVAGKTGTSNDAKDAWFAGYTTDIVCDSVQFLEPKGDQTDTNEYDPVEPRSFQSRDYDSDSPRQERKQDTPNIDVSEDDLPF